MRTTRLLLLPALGLVAFALLAVAFFASQASAAYLSGPPVLYQTPAPMRPAPGLIPPSGLGPESPSVITFSAKDVRTYVLAHGFIGGAIVPGYTLRILSIQLMTPQQADAQGAELEAYTTTTMVYVVKMEGPFYTTNAALINPTSHNTTLTGYEIFDAHTGDTLEWGF
jgi:hypothetical protein